ncbi:MAG: hypothetical protein M9932_05660 [Xanthobacteraceae bacterium]|nr:hypothetical protein [Xanthobacteraceae bacterium]
MSIIIKSPKAKAEMKAILEKGQTKAKTAKTTTTQQKVAAKITAKAKEAKKTKSRLSAPSELARCRIAAGGDIRAGQFLYRITFLWRAINPKLTRHGKEWLAMPREEWATSSGLGWSEFVNYALPLLRKHGQAYVEIHAWGRGKDKKLWVSLDQPALHSALAEAGYEIKIHEQNGLSLLDQK